MKLFDTHAHLYEKAFDRDRRAVYARLRGAGVVAVVCVAYDLESARRAVAMAEEDELFWASAGIHPHDAKEAPSDYLDELETLLAHPRVVALGETGLDYYRNLSPRPVQQEVFRSQLALAREKVVPVIIHAREAFGDLLDILRRDGVSDAGGVMHCFSGSWEVAQECLKMGFYISLAGPVTYKNASRLHDLAVRIPLDRLVIETDCPFLAPEPFRGQRNEPAYVRYVAEQIASLRGIEPEEVGRITTANACKLFGLQISSVRS